MLWRDELEVLDDVGLGAMVVGAVVLLPVWLPFLAIGLAVRQAGAWWSRRKVAKRKAAWAAEVRR